MNKPDITLVREAAESLKGCLEADFDLVYVHATAPRSGSGSEDSGHSEGEASIDRLKYFRIEKIAEPIYTSINSEDDLDRVKNEILSEYESLIHDFVTLFDQIYAQIQSQDNVLEGLEIIEKTLQNRLKKMRSAFSRFKVNEFWDIEKIQLEFSHVLQKVFMDILQTPIDSIYGGMKYNSVYGKVLELINKYFAKFGVYTHEYQVNEKIDDDHIDSIILEASDEYKTDDVSKKDVIAKVHSLAYLFENSISVLEAKVTVWSVS